MLELLLCSSVTLLPDYLYRRYVQGKRLGSEITLFSVWYELRWGIIGCLMLTVALITVVFYNHPSSTTVTSAFRVVPILSETSGRVAEVLVSLNDDVAAGQPLVRLESTSQQASLDAAQARSNEIDAQIVVARTDLAAADGRVTEAEGSLKQARDELQTKIDLQARNSGAVTRREIEQLETAVNARLGAVTSAMAAREAVVANIEVLLPAQKASAEAAVVQARTELDKTVIRAGVSGRVEQFTLRPGEVVNPMLRPAGFLIPDVTERRSLVAGFGQIEARVLRVGLPSEVTCVTNPFRIIPMVVSQVQPMISGGQVRVTDQLIDATQVAQPGTILVYLEPLFAGGLDDVPQGATCIANVYSNNHDRLASGEVTGLHAVYLHAVDALAMVHALILRMQMLVLPVQTLVLSGGH
jgi:multidrug resistance efflux pump